MEKIQRDMKDISKNCFLQSCTLPPLSLYKGWKRYKEIWKIFQKNASYSHAPLLHYPCIRDGKDTKSMKDISKKCFLQSCTFTPLSLHCLPLWSVIPSGHAHLELLLTSIKQEWLHWFDDSHGVRLSVLPEM